MMKRQISVFSGFEFNVDPEEGLNGICDFLIARSPSQPLLQAPVLAIVEAKRENILDGIGQCVAAMIGVQRVQRQTGQTDRDRFRMRQCGQCLAVLATSRYFAEHRLARVSRESD